MIIRDPRGLEQQPLALRLFAGKGLRVLLLCALAAVPLACGAPGGEPETDDLEPGPAGGPAASEPADTARANTTDDSASAVVFLGNSLTAGFGLTRDEAYPALIQARLDSAGYDYRALNAGVSGQTSAGGLRQIDWLLDQPVAVLVLALGANDALRGQDLAATRRNLQGIIDRTRERHPGADIVIAGMRAPPNLGEAYTQEFRTMFADLAREYDAALIPFLLEGVAAVPGLNQADGIHPTAEGQRIMAETVWQTLEPVLRERRERRER